MLEEMVWTSSTSMSDASQLAAGFAGKPPESGESSSAEAPAADPLVGQLLDGRYRVIERLAEGGMGTVYRAEHVALRKDVALKLVQDGENVDHAMRFLREAMLISRVEHPNVVSAIDYGTFEQGAAYLVMSLVEGPTLAHVLRSGAIPWKRAAKIGAQIADAIAAAHARGIVHRDLKPENVVLQPMADGTEVVKVLDFGLAKYARDSMAPPQVRGAQQVTRTGVVVGTPGYMAPEQAVGLRADHRVDLYALGVLLWECVAGRRLWDCNDVQRLLTQQLSSRPPLLRTESGDASIPDGFEALVAELLATRPENRPQGAAETRERLRALLEADAGELPQRAELLPAAQPSFPQTPPDTDTLFIDAAVAGWRAGAVNVPIEPAAGSSEQQPPTHVFEAMASLAVVEQLPTQVGFRAARAGAAAAVAEVVGVSPPLEPPTAEAASEPESVPAAAPADVIGSQARTASRLYVAVPLALVLISSALWVALAGGSSATPAPGSARARTSSASEPTEPSGRVAAPVHAAQLTGSLAAAAPEAHASPAPAPAKPVATTRAASQPVTAARPRNKPQDPGKAAPAAARAPAPARAEPASALRAKARAHFRRAEFELAALTYREAIKKAPGYAGAYAGLGASQLALGDALGAVASYQQAIRRSPGSSGFHAALGRAYLMIPDRERALAEYRKAVALDPANDVAAEALARLTL